MGGCGSRARERGSTRGRRRNLVGRVHSRRNDNPSLASPHLLCAPSFSPALTFTADSSPSPSILFSYFFAPISHPTLLSLLLCTPPFSFSSPGLPPSHSLPFLFRSSPAIPFRSSPARLCFPSPPSKKHNQLTIPLLNTGQLCGLESYTCRSVNPALVRHMTACSSKNFSKNDGRL